eukprot:8438735-Pyramimonas_sp.AAC.2
MIWNRLNLWESTTEGSSYFAQVGQWIMCQRGEYLPSDYCRKRCGIRRELSGKSRSVICRGREGQPSLVGKFPACPQGNHHWNQLTVRMPIGHENSAPFAIPGVYRLSINRNDRWLRGTVSSANVCLLICQGLGRCDEEYLLLW